MAAIPGCGITRSQQVKPEKRISLADNFQFNLFREAMNYLNRNKAQLSDYDLNFYRKLRDGWDFAKREMTITVKQLNHLRQVETELREGKYRG